MNLDAVVDTIVDVMIARENDGKEFGVIVLAEGLAQFMPAKYLEGVTFDDHGNISLSQTELARNMTKLVEAEYEQRQGKKRRVTGLQLGYEARCALPHAFDVILGSQLGVGACRALVENQCRRRARLGLGPAQSELCSVRHADRAGDAAHLHAADPAGVRLSAAGAIARELSARLVQHQAPHSLVARLATNCHSRIRSSQASATVVVEYCFRQSGGRCGHSCRVRMRPCDGRIGVECGALSRNAPECGRELTVPRPAALEDLLLDLGTDRSTSGNAIASLVLGMCLFLGCLSGLPAIWLGRRALVDVALAVAEFAADGWRSRESCWESSIAW